MVHPSFRSVFFGLLAISACGVGAHAQPPADLVPVPSGDSAPVLDQASKDTATYRQHVTTLSSPFFEGRAPGTRGNRLAAEYIEFNLQRLALTPAFPTLHQSEGGENKSVAFSNFRQEFEVRSFERENDFIKLRAQELSFGGEGKTVTLSPGTDFNAIGYSGSGSFAGPLVFTGYAINSESKKYTSFPKDTDLKGKAAMVFRFEPMKDDGASQWAEQGWSFFAGLEAKITQLSEAGASAIILVNPPGAKDERANILGDLSLKGRRPTEIPVVMMSADAADRLVKSADPNGRSLLELRRHADNLKEGENALTELPGVTVAIKADIERTPVMTDNVGAVLRGAGPLADEYVVIGAHYDHVGYGYTGAREQYKGMIHYGADDNASGTSGLLLVAERLSRAYAKLPSDQARRSILFLAFSSEEAGLFGSKHYVKNMIAPKEKHTIMLNMDMIGRLREDRIEIQGDNTAQGLEDWFTPFVEASGLNVFRKKGGRGPSDHQSFYDAQIPVLFFFTRTHPEYHTPKDTFDTLNIPGAVRIVDMVERVALAAATKPDGFAFAPPPSTDQASPQDDRPARMSFRVRFGARPEYSAEEKGLVLEGVSEGSPAEKAGLKAGDVVTRWNGEEVVSVESWMGMLREANPGDHVRITYRRKTADTWSEHVAEAVLEEARRQRERQ